MKKVGLMTIFRVDNYGSVLQTYATIKKVEELGYDCTLIDYVYPSAWHLFHFQGDENKSLDTLSIKSLLIKALVFFRLYNCGLSFYFIFKKVLRSPKPSGLDVFRARFKKTVPLTHSTIGKKAPLFDLYLTGSDQTWNSRYLSTDYSYLLSFAPTDAPRIAYSASFGANQIEKKYERSYKKYLSLFRSISVREYSGIELVRSLADKNAIWTVDPTLLFTREDWISLAKYDHVPNCKFIFCYILEYVFDPFPDIINIINQVRDLLKCDVYVFCQQKHREIEKNGYIFIHDFSPEEFLGLYEKASFVISNSFHGTIFSINFGKDFFSILNPNQKTKDGRVKENLRSFHLESRGIYAAEIMALKEEDIHVDTHESMQKLMMERSRSFDYLRRALEENSGNESL